MAKKRADAPNQVENLPSAQAQEDGKRFGAKPTHMPPLPRRTVDVPIIKPLNSASEPLAYQKVELPSADDISRRWGAHQQSIKEQTAKKTGAKTGGNASPSAPAPDPDAPISRDTMIMDLVTNHSEVLPILMDVGLHCIGCQLSAFDTIEAGCALHGFDSETIDTLIKTMNTVIKQTRKDHETAEKAKAHEAGGRRKVGRKKQEK